MNTMEKNETHDYKLQLTLTHRVTHTVLYIKYTIEIWKISSEQNFIQHAQSNVRVRNISNKKKIKLNKNKDPANRKRNNNE